MRGNSTFSRSLNYLLSNFKLIVFLGILITSFQAKAQYCGGGPSSTGDSDVTDVILNGETKSISNLASCPGVTGVQNLTHMEADVALDSSYSVSINFSSKGNFIFAGLQHTNPTKYFSVLFLNAIQYFLFAISVFLLCVIVHSKNSFSVTPKYP